MDNNERIRILETANEGAPGTLDLADWLEEKANDPENRMPYLDPEWTIVRVASPGGTREPDPRWEVGDDADLPSLRSLDDARQRSLMRATRAARGLIHEWQRLRDESLLALFGDGGTQRTLAGMEYGRPAAFASPRTCKVQAAVVSPSLMLRTRRGR